MIFITTFLTISTHIHLGSTLIFNLNKQEKEKHYIHVCPHGQRVLLHFLLLPRIFTYSRDTIKTKNEQRKETCSNTHGASYYFINFHAHLSL